jgi:hypothetical protein
VLSPGDNEMISYKLMEITSRYLMTIQLKQTRSNCTIKPIKVSRMACLAAAVNHAKGNGICGSVGCTNEMCDCAGCANEKCG